MREDRRQINFFQSFQAKWDLLVQQEGPSPMAESVISQTSTSSSSNGGSQQNDPRDNFSSSQQHRRFSRSSADDDDSDPCTSYPYLPLDESPESLLARRHSLPFTITFYDEDFVLVSSKDLFSSYLLSSKGQNILLIKFRLYMLHSFITIYTFVEVLQFPGFDALC